MQWREFVEDDAGRGSAARLNMVIGVLTGSAIVLWLAFYFKLETEFFAVYMLATGGIYGLGKWRESVVQTEQIRADSPNQAPVVVPPVQPVGPTTLIQVGQPNKLEAAKDVEMNVEGNVNVNGT